jgi:hypothetical protein
MNVDLYKLEQALDLVRRINAVPLAEVAWLRGGRRVTVIGADLEEWKFTGLSNVAFAKEHGLVKNGEGVPDA